MCIPRVYDGGIFTSPLPNLRPRREREEPKRRICITDDYSIRRVIPLPLAPHTRSQFLEPPWAASGIKVAALDGCPAGENPVHSHHSCDDRALLNGWHELNAKWTREKSGLQRSFPPRPGWISPWAGIGGCKSSLFSVYSPPRLLPRVLLTGKSPLS